MAQGDNEAALVAEVQEMILSVKMNRRDGMSFLYLESNELLRRLPEQIGRLDWMTWLDLEGTHVSDLGPLAPLTRLEKLDLRGTAVTDLSALKGMTALRHLFLEGSGVSDLSPLAGMGRLRELWLNHTGVTDLSPLKDCIGLRQLSLRGTEVSDLSPLAGLPDLAVLDITGTQVGDLTPLLRLPAFCEGEGEVGISFENTPAAARSKALSRIASDEEDPGLRAEDLVDHLTGGALQAGWRGDA
ncbi:leucine-rich repeat domain-containing protein [Antarctobacter sp.]|uniref:leucine-rich repeat domain-containing protein n=1 Tax=Antarctobacter sp. TaxID=1872577 RepID=UPI002B265641|nr:leucine-rich repeat domain-containing protein [Antarctobacter sp.]